MKKQTASALAECAVMLAIASALSFIPVFQMPYGGTVTLCSMVPLLYVAFRYPPGQACLTALAFGLLQMLFAFFPPPARTILAFTGVIALDYVIAFGILGLAGVFARLLPRRCQGAGESMGMAGMLIGGSAVIVGRFLCHFLSGILVWNAYAPEGQSAALYSFLYNGSFMLGEWLLSMAALIALRKALPPRFLRFYQP